MRKKILDRLSGPGPEQRSALLCLATCFMVGIVGGSFFAGTLNADAETRLSDLLSSYFSVLRSGRIVLPSLPATVWELVRWPLLAFILGYTALGVIGLPVAFCVRGFLFAYAVSVFVRLYGGAGLGIALAIFGISGILVLPPLFILGVDAFQAAGALVGKLMGDSRRTFPPRKGRCLRAGFCCGVLAIAIVLQTRLTPVLVSAAAKLLD